MPGSHRYDIFPQLPLSGNSFVLLGHQTIVPSAISSGETTEYQTFDVNVHAKTIKLVPKFQKLNQYFGVKEVGET